MLHTTKTGTYSYLLQARLGAEIHFASKQQHSLLRGEHGGCGSCFRGMKGDSSREPTEGVSLSSTGLPSHSICPSFFVCGYYTGFTSLSILYLVNLGYQEGNLIHRHQAWRELATQPAPAIRPLCVGEFGTWYHIRLVYN